MKVIAMLLNKLRNGMLALLLLFLLVWLGARLRVEWLTARHAEELPIPTAVSDWFGEDMRVRKKVLHYARNRAELYVYTQFLGQKVYLTHADGAWSMRSYDVIWSASGSADSTVWPFLLHTVEGKARLMIIGVPYVFALVLLCCATCIRWPYKLK